jgi:hypothetical protein
MKDKEPKCPECGASALRPRCLFELGGDCPRHIIAADWKKRKRKNLRKKISMGSA